MSRRPLRRLGLIAVTLLVAAFGLSATNAYADPTTGIITGHLTDGGAPVANSRVFLFDTDFAFIQETITDEAGAFSMIDLNPGTYKISFDLPGGFTQFVHQKLNFEAADTITVTAGVETTVDEEVIPHGSISGRVTNADGSALEGPFVVARTRDFSAGVQTNGDLDGNYSLPFVPAGEYIVSFRKDFSSPEQFANRKTTEDTADLITVGVGQQVILDQAFLPVGAISGRLTDDGQPVADAHVSVQSASGLFVSTNTDADGFYRMVLFPETYKIQYSLESGLTQHYHQKQTFDEADPVTVTAGPDTIADEELIDTGTVSGRLVDADGNPVADAGVDLQNNLHFFSGRTDENGTYEVEAFPGTYRLSFGTQWGQQWARGKSTAAEGDLITVVANQDLAIDETLARTGSITVRARDAATGQPIAGFCAFGTAVGSCTEDGVVTAPAVLPGRHEITVLPNDENYMFLHVAPVIVRSGENTALTVDLDKWATITTSVVDAQTGAPVSFACVEPIQPLIPTRLGNGSRSCTDADGSLTMRVEPGTQNLFAWAPDNSDYGHQWVGTTGGTGAQAKARRIALRPGQSVTVPPIRLDRAGRISGVITDKATGAHLKDAVIGLSSISGGAGPTQSHTFTDAQGRYTLGNLGPYSWTLFSGRFGYASEFSGGTPNRFLAKGVQVNVGQTTAHDVGLRKATRLTGIVTGPQGEPAGLFGGRIIVINPLTGDEMGTTDTVANSTYEIRVLGPQVVKLRYFANIIGAQYEGFYRDAGDLAHATPVVIPASGTKTVNVTASRPTP